MIFGKSIYISSSFVKEVLKTLRLIQLELEKQSEQGDVSNYQANGEFDLVNFSARRNVEYYSCCPEPYPDITYEIRLRRRPMFYVFNLILPCILINSVGEYIYIYIVFSYLLFRFTSGGAYYENLQYRQVKGRYTVVVQRWNRVKRSYRIWRRKFH